MSKILNGALDQYGAEPFEQQQFGTSGVEMVSELSLWHMWHVLIGGLTAILTTVFTVMFACCVIAVICQDAFTALMAERDRYATTCRTLERRFKDMSQ